MILFQQKQDGATSNTPESGHTHLLEISSNCAWERVRSRVLAWLSDLTKNSDGYPQTCGMAVGGFRVEIQPRLKLPTEIPMRLRESLGMSSMFAIRVKITTEAKSSPSSRFVSRPLAPSAAESAAQRLRDCNGLNVGSVHDITRQKIAVDTANTDVLQQSRLVDFTQQKPTSILARHITHDSNTDSCHSTHDSNTDSCQNLTDTTNISRQKTSIDLSKQSTSLDSSQHIPVSIDLSSEDDTADSKLACPSTELSSGVNTVRTAAEDASDHCGDCCNENTESDLNGHIDTSSRTHSDDSGNCGTIQQLTEDAAAVKTDGSSIGAECVEVANSSVNDSDRNFPLSADSMNFLSSSDQTVPTADCTEVACSLQAEDGNFPSSPGLNVPIACPLDLRT